MYLKKSPCPLQCTRREPRFWGRKGTFRSPGQSLFTSSSSFPFSVSNCHHKSRKYLAHTLDWNRPCHAEIIHRNFDSAHSQISPDQPRLAQTKLREHLLKVYPTPVSRTSHILSICEECSVQNQDWSTKTYIASQAWNCNSIKICWEPRLQVIENQTNNWTLTNARGFPLITGVAGKQWKLYHFNLIHMFLYCFLVCTTSLN